MVVSDDLILIMWAGGASAKRRIRLKQLPNFPFSELILESIHRVTCFPSRRRVIFRDVEDNELMSQPQLFPPLLSCRQQTNVCCVVSIITSFYNLIDPFLTESWTFLVEANRLNRVQIQCLRRGQVSGVKSVLDATTRWLCVSDTVAVKLNQSINIVVVFCTRNGNVHRPI